MAEENNDFNTLPDTEKFKKLQESFLMLAEAVDNLEQLVAAHVHSPDGRVCLPFQPGNGKLE